MGTQKDPIWISFKYERLNKFCFFCGCLDHVQKNCVTFLEEIENGNNPILEYDDSLKAVPLPIPPMSNSITDPVVNLLEANKQIMIQTGKEKGRPFSETFSSGSLSKKLKTGDMDTVGHHKSTKQKNSEGGGSNKVGRSGQQD